MDNEAMYLEFLTMLLDAQSLNKLGAALEVANLPSAFEAAHTLKGVVRQYGPPLYQAVCDIVEPLRAGKKRENYTAFYENNPIEYQKAEVLRDTLKGGG